MFLGHLFAYIIKGSKAPWEPATVFARALTDDREADQGEPAHSTPSRNAVNMANAHMTARVIDRLHVFD